MRKILVRWVGMTNDDGIGLLAKSFTPIEFNALEYTPEQLTNKYQIQANQTYSYTYTLKPISTSDVDASMEESKVVLP